jgi:hypothetical protein
VEIRSTAQFPAPPAWAQATGKEDSMAYDALAGLRAGGQPLDGITSAQRAVLTALSAEEVATINAIRTRIEAADGEVTAQQNDLGIIIY